MTDQKEKRWFEIDVTPHLNWFGVVVSYTSLGIAFATLTGKMGTCELSWAVLALAVLALVVPAAFLLDNGKRLIPITLATAGVMFSSFLIVQMMPQTAPACF